MPPAATNFRATSDRPCDMSKNRLKEFINYLRDVDSRGRGSGHPQVPPELRPHTEIIERLETAQRAEPSFAGRQRGQQQLLAALTDLERGDARTPMALVPAFARVAAAVAGIVLLAGGTLGASAALGGPDVGGEVLDAVGINNAPDDAQNGKDHANENAFEGSDNAGQGINNAPEAAQNGKDHANENAFGESADDDSDDADDSESRNEGLENAEEHADDEADKGLDRANDAGPQDETPASPQVPDETHDNASGHGPSPEDDNSQD